MEFIVTTTRDHQVELRPVAQRWARALQTKEIQRGSWNLKKMMKEYQLDGILVATVLGPKVYGRNGLFFYHPSMAKLRIAQLKEGNMDYLVQAMNLRRGMRVLDCTLGLAADALVASYVVGETGTVVGLEGSELLHFVVQHGLKNYECADDEEMRNAMRRIIAVRADAETYLASRMEEYDVVYFDPMFETPVKESSNMEPLRDLACKAPVTKKCIELALQRAPRVVVKERYIKYLRELGCKEIVGGKYSSIKYGIITR